ncbi:uncharacterized protein [Miscanthus floridulus]|uniref:uncharacterized protein n=1 Tax=Miscanthus floridulus TaxID=154761 RepID=UPI00345B4C25
MEAVPPPSPPPLQMTGDAMWKRLCPHSSRKRQAEAPALAPHKALKVSTSSTAQWVVEAQATIQHGTASTRANPKEPDDQGEATEAAMKQAGEEASTPCESEALEPDEVEAPSIAEATEGKAVAPRTSKAEAAEAGVSRTTKAKVAEVKAPGTTEAEVGEADMGAAKPAAQEAETDVWQALVPPPVQDPMPLQESAQEVEVHSISSDDTSWGKEVVDAEAASTAEQPAPTSGEGSSALVRWALHTGIKRALAVVSSHYASINLEAVSDSYVLAEDDEEVEEEVMKLVVVAEAPSTALAKLFEEEVVPPTPSADAGDPEF